MKGDHCSWSLWYFVWGCPSWRLGGNLESHLDIDVHKGLSVIGILVSRLFCQLVKEFLYEIISICQFIHVPPLSKLLQNHTTYILGTGKPCGQQCWCLEICLGTGGLDVYENTMWYEGGHTLWGLIAACPNISILLCHIWAKDRSQLALVHWFATAPHLTHLSLWELITSACGPQLWHIELFRFSIWMDHVGMMLWYCTMLKVCHLVHVLPYLDEGQIDDSEEPASIEIPYFRGPHIVTNNTNGSPSQLFDALAWSGFKNAKTNTPSDR